MEEQAKQGPSDPMETIAELAGRLQEVEWQRNNALNKAARLSGTIAVMARDLVETKKQLEELKKANGKTSSNPGLSG